MSAGDFGALPPQTVVQPCPLAWVEIELYDESGRKLVAGEAFELSLEGQPSRSGVLDGQGFARVQGIIAGDWALRFPKRGFDAWHRLRGSEPPVTWIEIEFLDAEGKPVAGEEYEVTPPNGGGPIKGRLDGSGKARVEVGVAGICTVNFPKRHATDYFPEMGHEPQRPGG